MLRLLTIGIALAWAIHAAAGLPPEYKLLTQDKGRVVLLDSTGGIEWEYPCNYTSHDIALLPSGNYLLHTGGATIVEVTPEKKVVWEHESHPLAGHQDVQIHAFQRFENGNTMIAESGNGRIIEVDKDDKIIKTIALTLDHPSIHSDTRLVRKLDNGHYLVAHENDGIVPRIRRRRQSCLELQTRPRRPARIRRPRPRRSRDARLQRLSPGQRQHPDRWRQQQPRH